MVAPLAEPITLRAVNEHNFSALELLETSKKHPSRKTIKDGKVGS
jgi:hypothetical protein